MSSELRIREKAIAPREQQGRRGAWPSAGTQRVGAKNREAQKNNFKS
ncbi:MAG: hypothetical protein QNJ54_25870 [Prochloraceae cyanobacterium]|nr:hypothetical protein [Prochloraceae cyanobacterium]